MSDRPHDDGGLHYIGGYESFDSTWSKQFTGEEDEERERRKEASKRYERDFALWKAAKPGEPYWDSAALGKGRPGWHIECSAMVASYFGDYIDVHSGGIDLLFPHHTNECAQSEAWLASKRKKTEEAVQRPWCHTWLHTGHLYIDGLKMSKSLKNFISIREYLDGGYSQYPAEDFRLFCVQHKYHSSLHFSKDRIEQAAVLRERVKGFLHRSHAVLVKHSARNSASRSSQTGPPSKVGKELSELCAKTRSKVTAALSNDFDTPTALAHINVLISSGSQYTDRLEAGQESNIGPLKDSFEQVDSFFQTMGLYFSPMLPFGIRSRPVVVMVLVKGSPSQAKPSLTNICHFETEYEQWLSRE